MLSLLIDGDIMETDPSLLLSNPEHESKAQTLAILEFGAQYALDIEQQAKRLGFRAVRLPIDTPMENLYGFGGIILSGGPESVYDPDSPKCDPRLMEVTDDRPPVLGICYGQQLMNHMLGGKVLNLDRREDGFTPIHLSPEPPLFTGLDTNQEFIMSHGDTITKLADGFEATAYSGDLIAAIENTEKRLYGVQFHPEVSPPAGTALLRNFLADVCGLGNEYEYTYEELIADAVTDVRTKVGDKQVLAYISGGVDSSALAKLLERALPSEQVSLVLVDHGFMRSREIEKVQSMLADAEVNVMVYDASRDYLTATTTINGKKTLPLNSVSDPEVKRKIIGDTFITIQQKMAEELGLDPDTYVLAMGTLYTDLIESGSKHASDRAAVIKSHHNDTELVRNMREAGRVIEPWKLIQKDDVRTIGKILGLPEAIYERQPFPGPGLAIRIICGEIPYVPENRHHLVSQLAQFDTGEISASLLPIQTVGVQGDSRTYGHLTALSGKMDWRQLKALANEIPRTVHGVNRVAYVFGEPVLQGLDSITPTFLTEDTVAQLKHIDDIVNIRLEQHGLDKTLSQVPVILLPVHFGEPGKRSVAIRTFMTTNYKTGRIALPGVDFPEDVLLRIVDEIMSVPGIARVLYDLTSKPPATTEWE